MLEEFTPVILLMTVGPSSNAVFKRALYCSVVEKKFLKKAFIKPYSIFTYFSYDLLDQKSVTDAAAGGVSKIYFA